MISLTNHDNLPTISMAIFQAQALLSCFPLQLGLAELFAKLREIWGFPSMGIPHSWMVYFMENPMSMDDEQGYPHGLETITI